MPIKNRVDELRLKIAVGKTRESHDVENQTWSWPEFVAAVGTFVRDEQITQAQYAALPSDAQLALKDKGYYVTGHFKGARRKGENLEYRGILVLDLDHGPAHTLDALLDSPVGQWRCVVTSTRKDTIDKPRLRALWLLDRPVNAIEYQAVGRRVAQMVGEGAIEWFDHTGFQFSRVMFWPSVSRDQDFVFEQNAHGEPLPVDEILATYADYKNIAEWPVCEARKHEIHASVKKVGDPLAKPGIIGAFNRVYDIKSAIQEFIPGVYVDGDSSDRLTYAAGSSSNGAVIYDNGSILYSNHETDPCFDRSVNAFDLVRIHLFGKLDAKVDKGTPVNMLPSVEKMANHVRQHPEVASEYNAARFDKYSDDFADYLGEDAPVEPQTPEIDESEPEEIEITPEPPARLPVRAQQSKILNTAEIAAKLQCSKLGDVLSSLANAETILLHDQMFSRAIALNTFSDQVMLMRPVPGLNKKTVGLDGVRWNDDFDIQIRVLMERKYHARFSKETMHDAVRLVARRYSFHPIKQILESLPEWDGVERLDTFFVEHYGSADNEYTRAITRKWFCAAIARIYKPGCKFDQMIVLEGVEGILKSTVMEVLFYNHFTDGITFGLQPKEFVERVSGYWCCEIAEMVTRSAATAEENAAFISRRKDTVRLSYARLPVEVLRQNVFLGTTNEKTYLVKQTGNRRNWAISGDGRKFNPEALYALRDQLWAEAMMRYRDGEPLYLETATARAAASVVQEERTQRDEWTERVAAWLDQPVPANYWESTPSKADDFDGEPKYVERDRTCLLEIWERCIEGSMERFDRRVQVRLGSVMRNLPGWEQHNTVRFGARYGRGRGFMRKVEFPKP